jgi:hypothetical protein
VRYFVGGTRDGMQRRCILGYWNSSSELQQRQIGLGVGRFVPPCFIVRLSGFLKRWGLVLPDADFECMGVLMEHSQDVKSVAWHPREEVSQLFSLDPAVHEFFL